LNAEDVVESSEFSTQDAVSQVKECLGEPAVAGERFLIYEGDCTQYLERIPSGSIPLIVTSPPYNIGKEYETLLPLTDYLEWCGRWIHQLHRLSTDDGAFWLNLGYISIDERAKAIPIPYLLWDRVPYFLIQEIVWNYGAGVAGKTSFSPRNEKFLWYVKNPDDYTFNLDDVRDPNVAYPNQKKNGKLKCNPLGKNPSDVWNFAKVTSGQNRSSKERTPHPAQFPLGVIDRIIKASSNPGDAVLDPFLGSGSVIEAALRTGRVGIGFEINPAYVKIAANRIKRFLATSATTQTTMF
jgi:adenine-specific DNA-methyltransferase